VKNIPLDTDILITHSPVFSILDYAKNAFISKAKFTIKSEKTVKSNNCEFCGKIHQIKPKSSMNWKTTIENKENFVINNLNQNFGDLNNLIEKKNDDSGNDVDLLSDTGIISECLKIKHSYVAMCIFLIILGCLFISLFISYKNFKLKSKKNNLPKNKKLLPR
jgi:hypothetical protein